MLDISSLIINRSNNPIAMWAAVAAATRWYDHPLIFALALAVALALLSLLRRSVERAQTTWSQGD